MPYTVVYNASIHMYAPCDTYRIYTVAQYCGMCSYTYVRTYTECIHTKGVDVMGVE